MHLSQRCSFAVSRNISYTTLFEDLKCQGAVRPIRKLRFHVIEGSAPILPDPQPHFMTGERTRCHLHMKDRWTFQSINASVILCSYFAAYHKEQQYGVVRLAFFA